MKSSHLAALAALFLIMVVAWYWVQRPETAKVTDLYQQVTGDFKTDDIKSISARVLAHAEKGLELKKVKDGWVITLDRDGERFPAPARKSKVERLVSLLRGLQGEVRAEGKEHLSTFGLEKGQGLEITLGDGKSSKLTLLVGMKGPDWGSCFVRLPDSDKVYLVSRDILSVFDIWSRRPEKALDLQPWVDLDVISAYPGSIKECSYKSGSIAWSLESQKDSGKEDSKDGKTGKNKWIFEMNEKRHEKTDAEVSGYLSTILPLRARDIVPPSAVEKTGLSGAGKGGAISVFTYSVKSGPEASVEITGCQKEKKFCLVKSRGYVFQVDMDWKNKLEHPFSKDKKDKKTGSGSGKKKSGSVK
ncbi:MAG: hypothetical protein DSZ23_06010 [Thermodesulfatator sp.]|nr:MAG: hypothetical protein DSZ23_06010 [Thermodesulfatator sp.]